MELNLLHFCYYEGSIFPFKFVLNEQEISPTQDVNVVCLLFYASYGYESA